MGKAVLSRILAMPWSEVMGRTRQEIRKLQDRALPPGPRFGPSLGPDVRGAVPPGFPGLADPGACARWCHAHDPERVVERVRQADRIIAGEVPLLGWGWLDVGSPPEWHRDPVTGRAAPDLPWSRIDFLDPESVGDSKAVWELSRHQYLMTLAQAYRLTGDDGYKDHVWASLRDWIDRNPLGHGVNWSSSLEVAFRAVSWSWLWHLADGRETMDRTGASAFFRSLEWHGLHVERYLSTWFSPNTHLTGEALGLCALACFWPEAARARHWWRTGSAILDRELERQVGSDGFHMERSACYHRYTVDFYVHYLLLRRGRGDVVPDVLLDRVGAMVDALACLRRPDGRLVALGDEDGGRLLPLDPIVDPLDPGATLSLAAALLGRTPSRESGSTRWERTWILGPDGAREGAAADAGDATLSLLPEAGLAAFRAGGDLAVVSAGIQRESRDCTGHVHDDAMSVELWLDGAPVFLDPGTFSYTGDLERRAWYRGARAHNGVLPAHQVGPSAARPFQWDGLRTARLGPSRVEDGYGYLSLRCALGEGLVHDRLLIWGKGRGWLIWDRVRGPSEAALTARYQLPPTSPVGEWKGGAVSLGTSRILFVGPLVREGSGRLVRSDLSPLYGRSVPAAAWEAQGIHALPADGVTLVRASAEGTGAVRSRGAIRSGRIHRTVWLDGPQGERIGLSEGVGTDIADSASPSPVRVRWVGPGLRPLVFDVAGLDDRHGQAGDEDPSLDRAGVQSRGADDS